MMIMSAHFLIRVSQKVGSKLNVEWEKDEFKER